MHGPEANREVPEHATSNGETSHGTPVRVLIVDDSHDDAFLLKTELARRGVFLDYRRVDSAAEMASALASENWRLIISDHNMPGFDALGALEVLKRSGRDIPLIIHSGCISNQLAVSAMYEGVTMNIWCR